jgi:hypothetical protein
MDRRQLLRLISAAFLPGCAANANIKMGGKVVAASGIPLVTPSVVWNGTANSGGTPPTPSTPTSSVPQPAIQFIFPDGQCVESNTVIGVDAQALDGVPSVTFWVAGTSVTVARSIYNFMDATGTAQAINGFWIKLNAVAAATFHNLGVVSVYATANPPSSQPSITAFTIGPQSFVVANPSVTPVSVFTVRADGAGGAYTSIPAAFHAMKLATPTRARINITQGGTYDPGGIPASDQYTGETGYVEMTAPQGVTVVLQRGTVFDPLDSPGPSGEVAWEWYPGCGPIHFTNISFEMHTWYLVRMLTSNPHWFDACTIQNSVGTTNTLYWNKAPPPAFQVGSFNTPFIGAFFTNCTVKYVDVAPACITKVNCNSIGQTSGDHGEIHLLSGNYDTGSNCKFFTNVLTAITGSYTGSGTARIVATSGSPALLDAQVNNGSGFVSVGGSFPLTLGNNPGAAVFNMADVVSALNAIIGGAWSFTTTDNTRVCYTLVQTGTQTVVIGTNTPVTCFFDFHTEYIHWGTGGAMKVYNGMFRGNIVVNSFFSTGDTDIETLGVNLMMIDMTFSNMVQDTSPITYGGAHCVTEGLVTSGGVKVFTASSDAFCLLANCIIGGGVTNDGTFGTQAIKNNAIVGTLPTGANVSGNVQLTNSAAFQAWFVSYSTNDFRPTSGALSNLVPKLNPFDNNNTGRSANDAMGAVSINSPQRIFPF